MFKDDLDKWVPKVTSQVLKPGRRFKCWSGKHQWEISDWWTTETKWPDGSIARRDRWHIGKCKKCGYEWKTKSKLMFISCPSCMQKVKNGDWGEDYE